MSKTNLLLEASNRMTFKQFDVGDKLVISHFEHDPEVASRPVAGRVEYGVVTGFDFNSYGEMLVVVAVVGKDIPAKLHPSNCTFTIKNLSKDAR